MKAHADRQTRSCGISRLLNDIVEALESDKNLPERIAPPDKPDEVENPFA